MDAHDPQQKKLFAPTPVNNVPSILKYCEKHTPAPSARTTPSLSSVINSEWTARSCIGEMTIGRRNFLDFESSSRTEDAPVERLTAFEMKARIASVGESGATSTHAAALFSQPTAHSCAIYTLPRKNYWPRAPVCPSTACSLGRQDWESVVRT